MSTLQLTLRGLNAAHEHLANMATDLFASESVGADEQARRESLTPEAAGEIASLEFAAMAARGATLQLVLMQRALEACEAHLTTQRGAGVASPAIEPLLRKVADALRPGAQA